MEIHCYEYKFLLQADRLELPHQIHEFWVRTRRAARTVNVLFLPRGKPAVLRGQEVLFIDTPAFDLYKNNFILRRRARRRNISSAVRYEWTLKFRHANRDLTFASDVVPRGCPGRHVLKFQEEALAPRMLGSQIPRIYSHACAIEISEQSLAQSLPKLFEAFPALRRTATTGYGSLCIVNNIVLEERLVNVGVLDLGNGSRAKVTISVWRNKETQEQLAAEYSYQVKGKPSDRSGSSAKSAAEAFFLAFYAEASDWLCNGTTKTSLIYSLGKNPHKSCNGCL